ncbi:MAG: thiosulfate oxidation carrier complex protein SoxZ [Pseudaminobacter sp.]
MAAKIRIWLSNRAPAKGETVTVKAMVTHPMETGMRKNALSELIPRNIIEHFECTLAGETLLSWHLDTAISQNPYLEFRFVAQKSGDLKLVWSADDGQVFETLERIEVT